MSAQPNSKRIRIAITAGSAVVAAATPVIVALGGLDHLVLARLATNHNEVAATDE